MKKIIQKKYAELLIRSGVALKKGQYLVIYASTENSEIASLFVSEAYRAGARRVIVRFSDTACSRLTMKKAKTKELCEVLPQDEAYQKWLSEALPCMLYLEDEDPDGMAGLDPKKNAIIRQSNYKVVAKYIEARENRYQWCIAAIPGVAWAKKVFPGMPSRKAKEKLWEAILSTSRALDGNGIANWEEHDRDLKARCDYINSLRLKKLHYTSKNGTDLTVGLIPGVIFLGGGEKHLGGIYYQPNIPSEEIFTSPMKGEAEGIVYSAKPLSYNGQLIENFSVRFEGGKAVEVHAEKGEEALRSILSLDEGSAYLGECALVPYDSPINNTGLLFYNTLFDENACCHLALGRGFTNLYPEYEKYTEEEIHSFGINHSLSHVDFMIGSEDLNIVGITEDGKEIALFKDGNWAF